MNKKEQEKLLCQMMRDDEALELYKPTSVKINKTGKLIKAWPARNDIGNIIWTDTETNLCYFNDEITIQG